MADNRVVREKLRLLKRYMYEELKQIKKKVHQNKQSAGEDAAKGQAEVGMDTGCITKYRLIKHHKSHSKLHKAKSIRKYRPCISKR